MAGTDFNLHLFVWIYFKVTNNIKYNKLINEEEDTYQKYLSLFGNLKIIVPQEKPLIGFYDSHNFGNQRKFITEMAESQMENTGLTSTSIVKSTRMEDAPELTTSYGMMAKLPLISNKYFKDVNYLIGRPFQIASIDWPMSSSIGTKLWKFTLPGGFMDITQLRNVASYYAYFRPHVEIVMKINGTPMHYGRVMAFFGYPIDSEDLAPYVEANLYSYSNLPWVALSANSVQSATLEVPYLSVKEYLETRLFFDNLTDEIGDAYAQINLMVACPLSVNGDGSSSLNISIYMIVKDPGFSGLSAGYTYNPPAPRALRKLTTQSMDMLTSVLSTTSEAVEKAKDGVLLSTITRDLSTWFSKFTSIPYIGLPAAGIAQLISMSSEVLQSLGFNIPADVEKNMPVYFRNQRLLQMDDCSMAVPLAPCPQPYVVKDPSFIGGTFDDYDITTYCSHPMLVSTIQIKGSDLPGTILLGLPVRPEAMYYSTDSALGYYINAPSRMAYLARLFNFWRGSMRFHLSFVSSRFHTMRVRITWIINPHTGWIDPEITHYDDEFLCSFPSIILDVNGDTDISFTVPYHQATEWLNIPNLSYRGTDTIFPTENGWLLVTVVNSLISNDSTSPPPIYMQTFVSGGPDLQFAHPTLKHLPSDGVIFRKPPESMLSRFQAQSLDGFSSAKLKKCDAKPLAQYSGGSLNSNLYMSTNVTSLKHLMNMGGLVQNYVPSVTGTHLIRVTLPFDTNSFLYHLGSADPTTLSTMLHNNYLFNILPLKAYLRGAFRVSIIGELTGSTCVVLEYNQFTLSSNSFFNITASTASTVMQYSSEGLHVWKQEYNSSLQVDVPYYSITRATNTQALDMGSREAPRLVAQLHIYATLTANKIYQLYVGAGDDMMFSYDVPMPFVACPQPDPPPP